MSFEEYLQSKKINSTLFLAQEPEEWEEMKRLFEQVHPNSFTAQKKFLLNAWRRKFPFSNPEL